MDTTKVILMLLNQKFLPDPRVEQECDALKTSGFKVVIVADTNGANSEEYSILRINPNRGASQKYNLTLCKNPKLLNEITEGLIGLDILKIDAVHVHDLLWSFLGIQLSEHFKSKLVIDLHENYPALIADLGLGPKKRSLKQYLKIGLSTILKPISGPLWNVIKEHAHSPKRLRRYEAKVLNKCDRFIVVVDEALERFKGLPFYGKGVVVSNTKSPEIWKYDPVAKIDDKLVVTYMGTIQDLRGLDTAILAMKYLDQNKFTLNIVGIKRGDSLHRKFLDLIQVNNISNVNLVEWLTDEQEAFQYINKSHVCIVPHKNTELTQTTIPHKLFMYMAIGRPVLVSNVAPLKRIVEGTNSGLVFKAEDERDLAEKLNLMFNDDLLLKFSKNGRMAAEDTFNWKMDSQRLVELYRTLLN